ncbi:MAG TPA: PQQ-binding-like beta-propeller repeat protein [Gemmataceae bacterium]|jgi:outer membrane protein assembly factor BamB|nr:PQQ-binding-like beta-propeller repeat protein [Gemmataceae bacterium]
MRRLAALALLLTVGALRADDWPEFLGPRRDGTVAETGLARAWPVKGPPVLWKIEIGSGFSGPIVVGKRLVLHHRTGNDERIDFVDVDTGKLDRKLSYPTNFADIFGNGGPCSTPCAADGKVVALGPDGKLTCLALDTGAKLWAHDLVAEYKVPNSYFGVGSSPLIHDGRLLVNVGAPKAGVVAFALKDGKELWKATSDGASYSSPILARIDGAERAVFFTRNGPLVLDPATGRVTYTTRWRARINESVNAAPPLLLGDDRVFFTASYQTGALLLKLRKDGADQVWTSEDALSSHYTNAVTHGGFIFGVDGRQETGAARLRCIDPRPAAGPIVRWSADRYGCASIFVAGDDLILLNENGDLILAEANPAKYVEKARVRLLDGTPVRAVPAISGGRLFARDRSHLVCVDLRAGAGK